MSSTERNSLLSVVAMAAVTIFFAWATHHTPDSQATGLATIIALCCGAITAWLCVEHGEIRVLFRPSEKTIN